MVYIAGEEMSRYTMELIMKKWVEPSIDTSKWEFYDLSCKARDETNDQVLKDAVAAGARIGSIFKEPTITPTKEQMAEMGLSKALGSPNGAMRRGWNGITISRDTIHIPGIELGFKRPVLFERHAVGGEYGAGWKKVSKGRLLTTFFPENMDEGKPIIVDGRELKDDRSVCVVYDNPLDNVEDLAHIFFQRCLEANVVPYVVTKKTVFKWQEGFWQIMRDVFNAEYKAGATPRLEVEKTGGELQHLISDAATMQIIRWTDGGFGMACHNYDGDMLTDEVAQVHRSPGFITSNLIGKREDGALIKEFEASHGTVADLWHAHLRGEETSMNPLGMVVALFGAMDHAAALANDPKILEQTSKFTGCARAAVYAAFRDGRGTRDMVGPKGLTTEKFVDSAGRTAAGQSLITVGPTYFCVCNQPMGAGLGFKSLKVFDGTELAAKPEAAKVASSALSEELSRSALLTYRVPPVAQEEPVVKVSRYRRNYKVDEKAMKDMFNRLVPRGFDTDSSGKIDFEEFVELALELGIAPLEAEAVRAEMEHQEHKVVCVMPACEFPDGVLRASLTPYIETAESGSGRRSQDVATVALVATAREMKCGRAVEHLYRAQLWQTLPASVSAVDVPTHKGATQAAWEQFTGEDGEEWQGQAEAATSPCQEAGKKQVCELGYNVSRRLILTEGARRIWASLARVRVALLSSKPGPHSRLAHVSIPWPSSV
ncbi:icd [Symbiodinium natans]|uniref:Icd protein n=1 Tax=Symbiodinium natans TaxID=878477 RepID=A0A812QCD5_9DINO|nr:icd [Symbiodinium natans]